MKHQKCKPPGQNGSKRGLTRTMPSIEPVTITFSLSQTHNCRTTQQPDKHTNTHGYEKKTTASYIAKILHKQTSKQGVFMFKALDAVRQSLHHITAKETGKMPSEYQQAQINRRAYF